MSTIVYQEVSQSSSLSLKFSNPSKLVFSSSTSTPTSSSKSGWSDIEALSSSNPKDSNEEYVHPLAKRSLFSKSFMSEKSLEMCTESLGSETGAFFPESTLYFSTTATTHSTTTNTTSTTATHNNNNNNNNSNNSSSNYEKKPWHPSYKSTYEFPPPLTTITGANSLQVRPYRQDGRLVIEAVSAPSTNSCLRVERSNGRLKMTLVKQQDLNDYAYDDEENEEAEAQTSFAMEGSIGITDIDEEEGGQEKKEVKVEEQEEVVGVNLGEDMEGIRLMFGGKMGKGDQDFQRPSRCNEGGRGNIKRFINWEPFWVAT